MTSKKIWEHPWNKHMIAWDAEKEYEAQLNKPNPPSLQAVEKAKFVDKTYIWSRDDSVRPRNKRSTK
jgi:hypothetical protein